MRDAATAIELRHVTKKFPGVTALDDVSIIVSEGDVHAILGENGAGKSTLIKIISGVYNHGTFDGELYFFGERVSLGSIRDAENYPVRRDRLGTDKSQNAETVGRARARRCEPGDACR